MTWDDLIIQHLKSRGIDGSFYQSWIIPAKADEYTADGFVCVSPSAHLIIYQRLEGTDGDAGFILGNNIDKFNFLGKIEDPDFLDNLDKALEYYGVELLYE